MSSYYISCAELKSFPFKYQNELPPMFFFSIPESLEQVDWRIIWNIETDDDDETVSEI